MKLPAGSYAFHISTIPSKHQYRLDRLAKQLRLAPALTPDLFSMFIRDACTRLPMLSQTGMASRIDELIKVGTLNDAVFALIEIEMPTWKLRRLAYESGKWFCSLSQYPNLPVALDDSADATHEVPVLAILSAFLEARRRTNQERDRSLLPEQRIPQGPSYAVWCDDFG